MTLLYRDYHLNFFSTLVVEEILNKYVLPLKNEGLISFYGFIGLPKVPIIKSKKAMDETSRGNPFKVFFEKHLYKKSIVWANLPPAFVYHCKISKRKD
jgi:hypothetical protein